MKYFKFLPVLFLVYFACKTDAPSPNSSAAKQEIPAPKISLKCQPSKTATEEMPSSNVYLVLDGKEHLLANILACEAFGKTTYQQHQMPNSTLSAVGGWWAGFGEYFYLNKKTNNTYEIQYGQMYEEKETGKYDYTLLAEVKPVDAGKYAFFPKKKKTDLAGVYTRGGHNQSWMLVLQPKGNDLEARYYAIDGMLPPMDYLEKNPTEFKPQMLKQFDVDLSDMVLTSDLGGGQIEDIFRRERITFFDVKSNVEDVLRLVKDERYAGLIK